MTREKTEDRRSTGARHMLDGTVRVFLSESLLIPTGLLTTIFLTRMLGPGNYGIYGLAVSIVLWIEYSICNMFGGTSIKFIGETDDWEPIATTVLKLYLIVCAAAVLALWLFSGKIAEILNAPNLESCLSPLAIDIPIFVLSSAHLHILVGLGKFRERALTRAVRWLSRLVLIVVLVEVGLSVEGAILGIIASSLLELIIVRSYIRPPIFKHSDFDTRKLWGFVAPSIYILRKHETLRQAGSAAFERSGRHGGAGGNLCSSTEFIHRSGSFRTFILPSAAGDNNQDYQLRQ
ncbi:MAG: lipopolysaccharide biosynthesis protein [Thermodesulfobacteriota bacterium]